MLHYFARWRKKQHLLSSVAAAAAFRLVFFANRFLRRDDFRTKLLIFSECLQPCPTKNFTILTTSNPLVDVSEQHTIRRSMLKNCKMFGRDKRHRFVASQPAVWITLILCSLSHFVITRASVCLKKIMCIDIYFKTKETFD